LTEQRVDFIKKFINKEILTGVDLELHRAMRDLYEAYGVEKSKRVYYDRWLTGGVYFTNEEYKKEVKEIDGLKERVHFYQQMAIRAETLFEESVKK